MQQRGAFLFGVGNYPSSQSRTCESQRVAFRRRMVAGLEIRYC